MKNEQPHAHEGGEIAALRLDEVQAPLASHTTVSRDLRESDAQRTPPPATNASEREGTPLGREMRYSLRGIALFLALSVATGIADAQARRGSIYNPDLGPQGLVANKTAARIGDLITVVIEESQDVKNEETSDLEKSTDLSYAITNFDVKPNAFNVLPALAAESEDNFKGTANYKKKGTFTARLTAVVVDTLPNGNLVVNGRREIRIDQEVKVIEFSGIVRRYDIRADNSITSELVANARVGYTGSGPLTNSTNRSGLGGWIHDALGWLWPF
ncbi:MAG: flagellar basal body L-ring protein FlgH [Planctomycetota bacterium]